MLITATQWRGGTPDHGNGAPLRGATATASMKPATVETGFVVQVPQFVTDGEIVRVDTTEGKYIARVS